MIDVAVIAEAEKIRDNVYMVACPRCPDEAHIEPVCESWDLGYRCLDCGLIFKVDDRSIAGKYGVS